MHTRTCCAPLRLKLDSGLWNLLGSWAPQAWLPRFWERAAVVSLAKSTGAPHCLAHPTGPQCLVPRTRERFRGYIRSYTTLGIPSILRPCRVLHYSCAHCLASLCVFISSLMALRRACYLRTQAAGAGLAV